MYICTVQDLAVLCKDRYGRWRFSLTSRNSAARAAPAPAQRIDQSFRDSSNSMLYRTAVQGHSLPRKLFAFLEVFVLEDALDL